MLVSEVKIEKKHLGRNEKLKTLLAAMKAHGIDGEQYLPKAEYETCSFRLSKSCPGMANAIRRIWMSEIPTRCLHVTQYPEADQPGMPSAIYTDDEFIRGTTDVVIKNINSVPIMQDVDFSKYKFYLYIVNQTHQVINVRARDIRSRLAAAKPSKIITGGRPLGKKITEGDAVPSLFTVPAEIIYEEKNAINIHAVIPNPNITIARLRPGKTIFISDFVFETGLAMFDAAKFTLLNSIIYRINEPHFTDGGERSITHLPSDFYLSFTTAGNISARSVMQKTFTTLVDYMQRIKKTIAAIDMSTLMFFSNDEVSVACVAGLYTYKFKKHGFTSIVLLAQQCMRQDPAVAFCSGNVDTYNTRNAALEDIRVGVLKLKHLEPIKLINAAADATISEINNLQKAF